MTTPTVTRFVELRAAGAGVQADVARRTIAGTVAPWNVYGTVSTGQRIAFAPGSLTLGERVKLVLDHDPTKPVGVITGAPTSTAAGQTAGFRVPPGPLGDQALTEAAEGLRDGLSVGAEIEDATETDDGLYVTAARVRHVALLSEPAFDDARVTNVAASATTSQGVPVSTMEHTANTQTAGGGGTATVPGGPGPDPGAGQSVGGGPPMTTASAPPPAPTPAGLPAVPGENGMVTTPTGLVVSAAAASPALVRSEPYPYAVPVEAGGPSFVRDAWASMENPGSPEGERWRRGQAMAADPATIRLGMVRFAAAAATVQAATGTTVTQPGLVPDRWLPERFVPLRGAKAPLYTALAKYPTPDFNNLMVPRTTDETGLSGSGADEVTPVPPGNIDTAADTVVIDEVEGAYLLSRKLLMGSNPAIDRIASDALDRAWLADVETRLVTAALLAGNSTAYGSTYADGIGYIAALRAVFAAMAAGTLYTATDAIPAAKEYEAAAAADDTTERPLLPYGNRMNAAGSSDAAYAALEVQGVPLWPGPYMPANKTLVLDQSVSAATVFVTPVMNFRLEWTTDVATGGNVKVLKLVKYSGVGYWAQYPGGILVVTNSTPIATGNGAGRSPALGAGTPAAHDEHEAEREPARRAK
jgi:hypothetical protein